MATTCTWAAGLRIPKTKPTWKMTREQLARVVADHNGIHAHRDGGGWLYRETPGDRPCRPYIQGWENLSRQLEQQGVIAVGKGINWSRV